MQRTRSRLSTSVAGIAHAGADSVTTEGWPLKGLGRRLKDLEGRVECDVRRVVAQDRWAAAPGLGKDEEKNG